MSAAMSGVIRARPAAFGQVLDSGCGLPTCAVDGARRRAGLHLARGDPRAELRGAVVFEMEPDICLRLAEPRSDGPDVDCSGLGEESSCECSSIGMCAGWRHCRLIQAWRRPVDFRPFVRLTRSQWPSDFVPALKKVAPSMYSGFPSCVKSAGRMRRFALYDGSFGLPFFNSGAPVASDC